MQGILSYLKQYLPKTLFRRALLILLLPILVLQAVIASIVLQRHYDATTVQMAGTAARELNFAIARIEGAATIEEAQAAISELSERSHSVAEMMDLLSELARDAGELHT